MADALRATDADSSNREMSTDGISADKQLEILHDHYKETFVLIRDREKQRDRSFLFLILLYALLVFEIDYPASFRGSLGTVTIIGGQLQVGRLPLAGLLNVTWVLVLAVALTHCRMAINTERQYAYLHRLEEWLSVKLQVPDLYQREGRAYLNGYPALLNWTWVCYIIIFPVAIFLGTITLVIVEWQSLPDAIAHKLFDSGAALFVMISVLLYRVVPAAIERAQRRR